MGPTTGLANRYAGRLFAHDGRLHFVLDVDTASGLARVGSRADGEQQVIEMKLSEVGRHLSSSANLRLDGLNTTATTKRINRQDDGWYFTTRDGSNGPYPTDDEASEALKKYILSIQVAPGLFGKNRPRLSPG